MLCGRGVQRRKRERGWLVGDMGLWADLIDKVAGLLAYFPPSPPTYDVGRIDTTGELRMSGNFVRETPNCKVLELETEPRRGGGGGQSIIAVHITCSGAKRTILHSHGNAVDLGIMQSVYRHLSETLGVNVLGYDYSGYGWSTGKPSIRNTFADIRTCWNYLVESCGVDPKDIVLYGQSVGSGPTCEFASKLDELGGVVLHSPLASGKQVSSTLIESNLVRVTGLEFHLSNLLPLFAQ